MARKRGRREGWMMKLDYGKEEREVTGVDEEGGLWQGTEVGDRGDNEGR